MDRAALSCRKLTYAHAGGIVLDAIDADFAGAGPVLVTGATGAGKSTLLHLLAGMLRPTAGEVWADGQPVSRWSAPERDKWRRKVGMVFQHLQLMPDLSVEENILLPCIPRHFSWTAWAEQAGAWLARFELSGARHVKPHLLSGGQRQRVAWARAMIARPRHLFLDEPTAFQDDRQTRVLLHLLAETAAQGVCVVVSSHDLRLRQAGHLFHQRFGLAQGRLEVLR
jgi:putative ABC transport system ATP-binding protein